MYGYKKITDDMFWVGGNDRRLALFENVFPIPRGVSYNSYIVTDKKTVLLDTVDKSVSDIFFSNVNHILAGKTLDYVIVNHMEPDHCATLADLTAKYPDIKIIGNTKTLVMIKQFFDFDVDEKFICVTENDTLCTGKHTFAFRMAPMVHWPETMVTYDTTDKILYSADAFGTFGALNGNIFADEVDFETDWLPDARRYYANIVGKYGPQVQALLKKASELDIKMICPLHGPVWRKNIGWFIEKYQKWSTYIPEEKAVMIVYASVYGHTENTVDILALKLAEHGIKNIVMYDVSSVHPSVIVSEAFRCSHIVFASTTYNAGIFCNMETVLTDLKAHNLQNRTVAIIENGTWAPAAGALIKNILSSMKNIDIIENTVTLRSSLKEEQLPQLDDLSEKIYSGLTKQDVTPPENNKIEKEALFKLSYGLFILSAKTGTQDNACIINTVMQVSDNPKMLAITVNKNNYTHDMIFDSGIFNLSVLTTDTPFTLFETFGFSSGRDTDKFKGIKDVNRSENGLIYLDKNANAFFSCKIVSTADCKTHTLFIAEITEAKTLSDKISVTYQYYFDNIKPKPKPQEQTKKGFVCKICGFIYEGEVLPPDFICPICKHGADDFEPL